MAELTDIRVKSILEQYEKKRAREKERYDRIKETEEFKIQNRERAKLHYHNNKEQSKNKYESDRDFHNARSSYYYFKRNDRLDIFKKTHPDKVQLLIERNIMV